MALGCQGGVGKAEEEHHDARDESPEVQESDYEGESCCAEEDTAHKEWAKLGKQVTSIAQLGDAVSMVGAGHNWGDVEITKGFENR